MTDREEFATLRKRMFELADKMGMRIEIVVKRKRQEVSMHTPLATSSKREPGDE
jgi:hypothetical protein